MDDKQTGFTVTDRRKFTLDGELRDDAPAEQQQEHEPAHASSEKVVTMPSPAERELEPEQEALSEEEMPQFTAKESADQNAAYRESSRQIDDMLRQANPDMSAAGPITFEHIIQSFYVSAMLAMGAGTEPGQKARIDILGARQSIDMLALLQDKTKGNLSAREEATLQNVLFELRMMFLEITNAIAAQAQKAGDAKKK